MKFIILTAFLLACTPDKICLHETRVTIEGQQKEIIGYQVYPEYNNCKFYHESHKNSEFGVYVSQKLIAEEENNPVNKEKLIKRQKILMYNNKSCNGENND